MEELRRILRHYWGYEEFRPLQALAMQAVVDARDSVVVLPTGGGKSLCFQAPALLMPGLAVVVSPLISLMQDQVDALVDSGVPAAFLNSTTSPEQRRKTLADIRSGQLKLLYLSPERLMTEQTLGFLSQLEISFFAIDEAHCISDWGHDFRPEYRSLRLLKNTFPRTAIHAYTATATSRVRDDVVRQLGLVDPEILVGSFDRPNLEYRVVRRDDVMSQISEVIARHEDDSGIVYCIRRADVEQICATLRSQGRSALPYHAGMSDEDRRRNQSRFTQDKAKIIVATVAFGMGIDKPDVRYVIHAAAPKSLEHYQQESGRAGRDGLEAECWLFYSPADFVVWRKLQQNLPDDAIEASLNMLAGIEGFCSSIDCRHRQIMAYFGQELAGDRCGACDVCLDEVEMLDDPLVTAQKILSCVARLRPGFGAAHVGEVLAGSRGKKIIERRHDQLSTYGIMAEHERSDVRTWIEQLVAQQFIARVGEFGVLELTASGWEVLRGDTMPRLSRPAVRETAAASSADSVTSARGKSSRKARGKGGAASDGWEGVDRELFEELRQWRRQKATEKSVPPFVVCGDVTLRDLARRRPARHEALLHISGIGEKKAAEYGEELLEAIAAYCERTGTAQDVQ